MVTLANISAEALSSILSSEPITLLPSDSDSPVYIHERLLSSVSPPLSAAYQGEWKESKSRAYKFLQDDEGFYTDVTRDLLICFVRWAYLGDYSTEMIGIPSFVEEPVAMEEVFVHDGFSFMIPKVEKDKICGSQDTSVDEIPPAAPDTPIARHDKFDGGEKGPSTEMANAVDPLHLHIQLYVFANIYLIDALKDVSKEKILEYLRKVDKSLSKAPYTTKIFGLLEYASRHLSDDDPLLNWLGRYASWNLTALRQDARRLENLLGDGKFAVLLIRHVRPSQRNPFICVS
ncbi:hypothetical protein BKA61DRAFT_360661 [Leptodontidium sp. MPI-SDFR-AT-0119]|nr:hypothetical protein BKA61DRAFT_360661 [Leptodontidium sp. MPI-SDFR-AT-0119]